MQRLLNDGWRFTKLPNGSTIEMARQADWTMVDLPHDWLIGQADDLYENSDGWYCRRLMRPEDAPPVWLLRFDGVYMDCDVLVNGQVVCTHRYGYTAFDVDLSPHLQAGENELMVHVRFTSPNSRWYSGAGIYRDVTLSVLPQTHFVPDGLYVTTRQEADGWRMTVTAEVTGPAAVHHRLLDAAGRCVAEAEAAEDAAVLTVANPRLWSVADPYCYRLESTVGEQTVVQPVGFRTCRFSPEEGFFLNGEHMKLHGVCLHHDLGALGAAFHEKAARRQLLLMKAMGANALRTSHNPPARQVMDLCDELGLLVVDEAFDMWERSKTPYDYARFFPECEAADVAAWVRRDRNHPCLLMWSIGNEIVDTHLDARGVALTRMLADQVHQHDPAGNAPVTIGSNYMPWEGAQQCADVLKMAGYNYGEKYYAAHHAAHPDWCIYGSETVSMLQSRGVYHFPMAANILSDEDLQCSALGNSASSWGTKDLPRCLAEDLRTPYSMGQFVWAGIDYIGEPTPYHTRSSYLGQAADTACFRKDAWWLFQSMWTDAPMVHIGVHWDWNVGQLIDVPVMTNAAQAELLLNGESLGRKAVVRLDGDRCRPVWQVPYAPGTLTARGYDAAGRLVAEDVRHTFGDAVQVMLHATDQSLLSDGHDMTFVEITMADSAGHPVENAVNRVEVTVEGAGRLLGLDNGDSTDTEAYKTTTRRLFSGKLLAMVGALDAPGDVRITVTSPGCRGASLTLPVLAAAPADGRSCVQRIPQAATRVEHPVRRIELTALGPTQLNAKQTEVAFSAQLLPEGADPQPVQWRVVNMAGIDSPCAEVIPQAGGALVRALGDGQAYLRATCCNGYAHPRVISQLELTVSGLGQPNLNPYEFVAGGLYDLSYGELGAGNEQGVSFARDGESMAGFRQVDFGPVGSDEVTLPVFALTGEAVDIELWQEHPRQGGRLLATLPYQKPSQWNVYQPETYRLPCRLTGVQTLCFVLRKKIHLKGFRFTKQSRAWLENRALDADAVYGDRFTRGDEGICNIGNNVSLVYENVDFGRFTQATLLVDGATPLSANPITVRIQNEDGDELNELAQFAGGGRCWQRFPLRVLPGNCTVTFVFLPGSQFDFYGFRFEQ